jgi:hypothetical protein
MEDAGIALAIMPLLAGCIEIIKAGHGVKNKFKTAPMTLVSIATECSAIYVVLGELQHLRSDM